MKIYLDVCCLNRPFDDQGSDRIRLESEAVLLILQRIKIQEWEWVSSEVVDFEIHQTPDSERRFRAELVSRHASHKVLLDAGAIVRGKELEQLGFRPYDALHLACAEKAGVDVFLTTDDALIRYANREARFIKVRVNNPLLWLKEVTEG